VKPARPGGRESLFVTALAAAAALRVGLFSAAFPFFTNVDEHKHVDTVLKYARGHAPRPGTDAFEPQMGQLLGILGSPEYHLAPDRETPPPPWQRPPGGMLEKIGRAEAFLAARANKEAYQPPVYYLGAAAWLRVGRLLGLEGGRLLYWVRGLTALASAGLVLLAWRGLRRAYPPGSLVPPGVALLLAVFPQDAAYYVTPDALSPLLAGAAFLAALAAARPGSGARTWALAGGLTGLACLAKYTNVALFGVCALASARALRARPPTSRPPAARVVLLWALALAPLALWLIRNQVLFGDPTATALKVRRLGWESNPLSEWSSHPLFRPAGALEFGAGLVAKFWRGELVWRQRVLAWPPADALYLATTPLFLILAAASLLRGRDRRASRATEAPALAMLALSVAILVALSLLYVFPEVGNPSAARPWFDHGRLIAGALLPFLVLYVRGVEVATAALPERAARPAAWCVLALVAGVALLSEIGLTRPVFLSAYNAFHLP
jgi:hypothetical protein